MILVWLFFLFAYPRIVEIQEKKQELVNTYKKYNTVFKSGLSYNEFKDIITDGNESDYTKILLRNIPETFFKEHFTNTWWVSYNEFLKDRGDTIQQEKSSESYMEKERSLSSILPVYDWYNSWWAIFWSTDLTENISSDDTLSDFYFINYIENLLYSFNLSYQWDIGVWELINIDENDARSDGTQSNQLEENIYAIPLAFNIVWRKSDIVDFLHYFENVARIEISDNNFSVVNDWVISRRIEGDTTIWAYNIYENQLADIVSLSLSEYPNSSIKTTDSLIFAMKTLQGKERFEIDVEVQFYVAWVPWYKMQSYVNNFLEQYQSFSSLLKKDTQKFVAQKLQFNTSRELTAVQSLQNLNSLVIQLEEDILDLRKNMAQAQDISLIYNTAVEYNKNLQKIKSSYDENIDILTK